MHNPTQQQILLQLAKQSISNGLQQGKPLTVNLNDYATCLQQQAACFVTLHDQNEQLRGCIGNLEAYRPLIEDVSENAYAAAFKDPRFGPLQPHEFDQLSISISILTPATAMQFDSEADLISQIQPYKDGLILQEGYRKGTFLPSVWEQLPNPKQFIQHLKQKAGLPQNYWSDTIKISRYQTESFS